MTIPSEPNMSDSIPMFKALVLMGLASSNAEAKRLIVQGAVDVIPREPFTVTAGMDIDVLRVGDVLKVGKAKYLRLVDSEHQRKE